MARATDAQRELFLRALALPPDARDDAVRAWCGDDHQQARLLLELLRYADDRDDPDETEPPDATTAQPPPPPPASPPSQHAPPTPAIAPWGERARAELHEQIARLAQHSTPGPAQATQHAPPPTPAPQPAPPPAPAQLRPGARVDGFIITRDLATGGHAEVYEARQESPPRTVVLKALRRGLAGAARTRFEIEPRILARLDHPAIVPVIVCGELPDDRPYFVVELIAGARTLTAYAAERRLTAADRLALVLPVVDAIRHAHARGIIHRDLKPDNILVDAEGRPRLIDFGIARVLQEGNATPTPTFVGQLLGTAAYMSPEQAGDAEAADVRVDVFGLGAVLYELIAGRPALRPTGTDTAAVLRAVRDQPAPPPPCAGSPVSLRGLHARDLDAVILRAMAPDPRHRYADAGDLIEDLRRVLARRTPAAAGRSLPRRAARTIARHRAAVALVGVTAAALAASALSLLDRHRATSQADAIQRSLIDSAAAQLADAQAEARSATIRSDELQDAVDFLLAVVEGRRLLSPDIDPGMLIRAAELSLEQQRQADPLPPAVEARVLEGLADARERRNDHAAAYAHRLRAIQLLLQTPAREWGRIIRNQRAAARSATRTSDFSNAAERLGQALQLVDAHPDAIEPWEQGLLRGEQADVLADLGLRQDALDAARSAFDLLTTAAAADPASVDDSFVQRARERLALLERPAPRINPP